MSDELKTKWTKFWTSFFEGAWVFGVIIIFVCVLGYTIIREMQIWGKL